MVEKYFSGFVNLVPHRLQFLHKERKVCIEISKCVFHYASMTTNALPKFEVRGVEVMGVQQRIVSHFFEDCVCV